MMKKFRGECVYNGSYDKFFSSRVLSHVDAQTY